jgi:Domain of unknown function (DUF6894)
LVTRTGVTTVLFYFKLTDGGIVEDIEGLELLDVAAAREEAMGLARDLTRLELFGRDWSHWTVLVSDESGHQVLSMSISQNPRD